MKSLGMYMSAPFALGVGPASRGKRSIPGSGFTGLTEEQAKMYKNHRRGYGLGVGFCKKRLIKGF